MEATSKLTVAKICEELKMPTFIETKRVSNYAPAFVIDAGVGELLRFYVEARSTTRGASKVLCTAVGEPPCRGGSRKSQDANRCEVNSLISTSVIANTA